MQRQVILTFLLLAVSGLAGCRWHPDSPLVRAMDTGRLDDLRRLTPQSSRFDRSEALIWAARQGYADAIDILLAAGADPDDRDNDNRWTPLLHAIHTHQPRSVARLLAGGAHPDAGTPDGFTPLMMAAGYGYTDIVSTLLDGGANPRLVSRGGISALSAAVGGTSDIDRWTMGTCQTSTVRLLLDRVPDLRLPPNGDSRRSAWIASRVGRCSTIEALIKDLL
jgi:ankyrin repeat protein